MHHPTTLPVSEQTCSREYCATLFVSLELSRSTWVATSLALGSRKISKHTLVGGDARKLLDLLARLKSRAEQRIAAPVKVVAIQEAGLDGFWIHRLLEANGVESHVVDPASIAVPRRHRRAKTDAIDGETLLRTLMAWQRGEPRVCAMTVPPTPSEEDRRRVSRERATLLRERIRHTNRIRGLLFGQGITSYNPLHKNRRKGLEELRTGDGNPVPVHLKAEILREIDRLELVLRHINEVEAERDEMLRPGQASSPVALLMRLKGIGPE
ncbi:MAG: transposase, partial [Alphaproteobacteria bacterium]|nr:transposase [Alphaproteobacteria bacterium]